MVFSYFPVYPFSQFRFYIYIFFVYSTTHCAPATGVRRFPGQGTLQATLVL